jgi:CBS domain containing-hemolysin-like protein
MVPESSSVWTLMNLFQKHSRHIAIVLDEYGGTSGLITLEDLMEEIVGEIKNPFDDAVLEIQRINPDAILVDGLTLIEDVNEYTGKEFRDENYDTIAGFLLGHLDHIPIIGEEINLPGEVKLRVLEMDGLRISKIQITGV